MKILLLGFETSHAERLCQLIRASGHEFEIGDRRWVEYLGRRPELLLIDAASETHWDILRSGVLSVYEYPPVIIAIGKAQDELFRIWKLNLGVRAYLRHPYQEDELVEAINSSCRINAAQATLLAQKNAERPREYISVNNHRGIELIAIKDVIYFSADQKYVKVRHTKGSSLIDETLKAIAEEFPAFFRVHRSCLINLDYIRLLEQREGGKHHVKFRGIEDEQPVSRRHCPDLKEKIGKI